MARKTQADRGTDFNPQEVVDQVSELGERLQSGISAAARQVRSEIRELDIDETTIPDAFRKAPKLISPKSTHGLIWRSRVISSSWVLGSLNEGKLALPPPLS